MQFNKMILNKFQMSSKVLKLIMEVGQVEALKLLKEELSRHHNLTYHQRLLVVQSLSHIKGPQAD
jgi:hypothetical protein